MTSDSVIVSLIIFLIKHSDSWVSLFQTKDIRPRHLQIIVLRYHSIHTWMSTNVWLLIMTKIISSSFHQWFIILLVLNATLNAAQINMIVLNYTCLLFLVLRIGRPFSFAPRYYRSSFTGREDTRRQTPVQVVHIEIRLVEWSNPFDTSYQSVSKFILSVRLKSYNVEESSYLFALIVSSLHFICM